MFHFGGLSVQTVSRFIIQRRTRGEKSYFQPRKNNSDTLTGVCRLMDLDKQHKDGGEYSVFLGFMRKMAYLESVRLYSRFDALQAGFCLHFYLSNRFFFFKGQ